MGTKYAKPSAVYSFKKSGYHVCEPGWHEHEVLGATKQHIVVRSKCGKKRILLERLELMESAWGFVARANSRDWRGEPTYENATYYCTQKARNAIDAFAKKLSDAAAAKDYRGEWSPYQDKDWTARTFEERARNAAADQEAWRREHPGLKHPRDIVYHHERDEAAKRLGLSNGWKPADVKRVFREKVLTAHPDHGGARDVFDALLRNRDLALGRRP